MLTLQGHPDEGENRPYNGPPFPPQYPVLPSNLPRGGVIEADARQEEALQQRAMEWLVPSLLEYHYVFDITLSIFPSLLQTKRNTPNYVAT